MFPVPRIQPFRWFGSHMQAVNLCLLISKTLLFLQHTSFTTYSQNQPQHQDCYAYDDDIKWKIFRVTGPLYGEFTGHRWIPLTKASAAGLWCFLWSASDKRLSKQSGRWWFETVMIKMHRLHVLHIFWWKCEWWWSIIIIFILFVSFNCPAQHWK